jgi:hypothetical protein
VTNYTLWLCTDCFKLEFKVSRSTVKEVLVNSMDEKPILVSAETDDEARPITGYEMQVKDKKSNVVPDYSKVLKVELTYGNPAQAKITLLEKSVPNKWEIWMKFNTQNKASDFIKVGEFIVIEK